ncbi:MAG: DUF4373 domain-containing protein [Bacteroidales bacterium]|nr:DUF4373 domain-containing protein [Bacteroidales bacterium]
MLLSSNSKIIFFSHDVNMRNALHMRMLRKRLGNEAYALWLMLLEICASHEDFGFNLEEDAEIICFDLDTDRAHLDQLIDFCLTQKLLVKEGEKIYSPQLREHFSKIQELRQKRNLGGKKGMTSRRPKASDNNPSDNSPISEDNHIQPNNLTTEKPNNLTTEHPTEKEKTVIRLSCDCQALKSELPIANRRLSNVALMPPEDIPKASRDGTPPNPQYPKHHKSFQAAKGQEHGCFGSIIPDKSKDAHDIDLLMDFEPSKLARRLFLW